MRLQTQNPWYDFWRSLHFHEHTWKNQAAECLFNSEVPLAQHTLRAKNPHSASTRQAQIQWIR